MKKFIVIFLLSALTFPFWGSYTFFQVEKTKIRKEVERKLAAGIDKTKLLVFRFTREETETLLTWKHSREFIYKGHMYDVVEQREEGGLLIYTCYKDDKETRLGQNKEILFAKAIGQDPVRKSQSEKLSNFLKTVFSQDLYSLLSYSPEVSVIHFSLFPLPSSLFSPSPLSPPPKCS